MNIKLPRVAIGALVFDSDGRLLMLKSPKWHNKYILPSGHVEFGEKLTDAVKREVMEETGLNIDEIKFLRFDELIQSEEFHDKDRHFISFNFTCTTIENEVILNNEATEYCWVYPIDTLDYDLEFLTEASIRKYLTIAEKIE